MPDPELPRLPLAMLIGLIAPVHAGPPVVLPPTEMQLPAAPDFQPAPVVQVYLIAYRAHGPPALLLAVRATSSRSAWCIQYAYCGGDPVNYSDPSGLDRISVGTTQGRIGYAEERPDDVWWQSDDYTSNLDLGYAMPGTRVPGGVYRIGKIDPADPGMVILSGISGSLSGRVSLAGLQSLAGSVQYKGGEGFGASVDESVRALAWTEQTAVAALAHLRQVRTAGGTASDEDVLAEFIAHRRVDMAWGADAANHLKKDLAWSLATLPGGPADAALTKVGGVAFHAVGAVVGRVVTTSGNAAKLAANMVTAGMSRPAASAAHHIVASTSQGARYAQSVLSKYGIDINDAVNGVFLPKNKSIPRVGELAHSTLHTDAYYAKVNAMLSQATNKAEAIAILESIGKLLAEGRMP